MSTSRCLKAYSAYYPLAKCGFMVPAPTLCLGPSHAQLTSPLRYLVLCLLLFSFLSFSFHSFRCLRAIYILSKWPDSGILLMVVSTVPVFFRELTHLIVLLTVLTPPSYVLYAMPHNRSLILMIVKVQAHRRLVPVLAMGYRHRPYAPSLVVFHPH